MKILYTGNNSNKTAGIGFNIVISNSPGETFLRPIRPESEKYFVNVGKTGELIVKHLMNIDGVISIFISPYCLVIKISEAFELKKIEPQIRFELMCIFGRTTTFISKTAVDSSEKKVNKCWWIFNHNWSQWYDIEHSFGSIYQFQRKNCLNCGKTQTRKFIFKY